MIQIVRGGSTGPSSRAIRDSFIGSGYPAEIVHDPTPGVFSVNWSGCPNGATVNGKVETDKLVQMERFEARRVSTPEFSTTPHPGWMGRTRYHRMGKDFLKKRGFDFWTEPIKGKREFRAHTFINANGEGYIGRLQVKYLKCPEKQLFFDDNPDYPIRGRKFGWHMDSYYPNDQWMEYVPNDLDVQGLLMTAIQSLKSQEWDMGAVDLIESDGGMIYVLEANSCPGMKDTGTKAAYMHYLLRRVNE
jgi:hypothetical protein